VFEKGPFSAKRAAIFAALGGLLVGPALHAWYGTLGRLVTATGAAGSVQKLLLDQFLFAPAFIALILATCAPPLRPAQPRATTHARRQADHGGGQRSAGDAQAATRHERMDARLPCTPGSPSLPDWATVVTANWKLWIPFQFLNFRFVPPQLQVAAANVCAMAWNVILSLLSHAKVAEPVKSVAKKR